MPDLTVAVMVPARNEEGSLAATLLSVTRQTRRPDLVVVVDDASEDDTGGEARRSLARSGCDWTVVRTPSPSGSKAMAQNHGLLFIEADVVVTVDADTVLDPDYLEQIVRPFSDPRVSVAAGTVTTRRQATIWERGRAFEYLFGFGLARPVQADTESVLVCSGCCAAYRVSDLKAAGGFDHRTVAEDMDYTWSAYRRGRRSAFVPSAVARAGDPATLHFLRIQVRRWMHGFAQCARLHLAALWRERPWLALWVTIALAEVALTPLWLLGGALVVARYGALAAALWLLLDAVLSVVPALRTGRRLGYPWWRVLSWYPASWCLKPVNAWYAVEAVVGELVLRRPLRTFEKGH